MFSACCTEAAKVSTRSRPAGFSRESGDNEATSWMYLSSVAQACHLPLHLMASRGVSALYSDVAPPVLSEAHVIPAPSPLSIPKNANKDQRAGKLRGLAWEVFCLAREA